MNKHIPTIFANQHTYPDIMAYGQNNERDWFHPLIKDRYEEGGYAQLQPGDLVKFVMLNKDDTSKKNTPVGEFMCRLVSNGANHEYEHLKALFGDFIPGWNFTHVIRVNKL